MLASRWPVFTLHSSSRPAVPRSKITRSPVAMIEPLPYHRGDDGRAVLLDDAAALTRAVAIAAALGSSSVQTWLKVPSGPSLEGVLAASTLPALILGGSPGADPEHSYRAWAAAMELPTVRGLVVGRTLLYPAGGDVEAAVDRAARIVRPARSMT